MATDDKLRAYRSRRDFRRKAVDTEPASAVSAKTLEEIENGTRKTD
jgi:hypothetical protein